MATFDLAQQCVPLVDELAGEQILLTFVKERVSRERHLCDMVKEQECHL